MGCGRGLPPQGGSGPSPLEKVGHCSLLGHKALQSTQLGRHRNLSKKPAGQACAQQLRGDMVWAQPELAPLPLDSLWGHLHTLLV